MSVSVRRAGPEDASVVGALLHDFNVEFDTPTPSPKVVAARFARHAGDELVALLAEDDGVSEAGNETGSETGAAVGIALVSFRPTVWSDGPAVVLDELYVRPALRGQRIGHALLVAAEEQALGRGADEMAIDVDGEDHDARRFYVAHGYTHTEPGHGEPSYRYHRALRAL